MEGVACIRHCKMKPNNCSYIIFVLEHLTLLLHLLILFILSQIFSTPFSKKISKRAITIWGPGSQPFHYLEQSKIRADESCSRNFCWPCFAVMKKGSGVFSNDKIKRSSSLSSKMQQSEQIFCTLGQSVLTA